jgi:hypothetical protein
MLIPYPDMPPHSRVWVYQSNRELTDTEILRLDAITAEFISSWTAHNIHLKASYELRYRRFLIISVNEREAQASGCSIDKSLHFIKEVEKLFGISLLERMSFAYKVDENVRTCSRKEFEALIRAGEVNDHTLVFNNLVSSKEELDSNWEIPLYKSWHKQLVN